MFIIKSKISIDIIKAFTNVSLNCKDLLKNGWKIWLQANGNEQFIFQFDEFFFKYLPLYRYLSIQFSASKVINDDNAVAFEFRDTHKIIQIINNAITMAIPFIQPGESIPGFSDWIVNRLDIFADYNTDSVGDKILYLQSISRLSYGRCRNTIYHTSNHATSKSCNYNMYSKLDQILSKCRSNDTLKSVNVYDDIESPSINYLQGSENDDSNYICNNYEKKIRVEVQLKKNALVYRLNNKRKVKDIFDILLCKKLFTEFLKKINLDLPMLTKEESFSIIMKSFSNRIATNIIAFIIDYNRMDRNSFMSKYKKSSIYNYLNKIKKLGINPVYLEEQPIKYMDFLIIDYLDFIDQIRSDFLIQVMKTISLSILFTNSNIVIYSSSNDLYNDDR